MSIATPRASRYPNSATHSEIGNRLEEPIRKTASMTVPRRNRRRRESTEAQLSEALQTLAASTLRLSSTSTIGKIADGYVFLGDLGEVWNTYCRVLLEHTYTTHNT